MPTIKSVMAINGFRILALFSDNNVIIYDLHRLLKELPQFEALRQNEELFLSVHKSPGGYGIIWDDYYDLAAEEILENGTRIII